MDSIYDMPRRPPIPTRIQKVNPVPTVPEVSVFCSNNIQIPPETLYSNKEFNLPKPRQIGQPLTDNEIFNRSPLPLRRVHFESPPPIPFNSNIKENLPQRNYMENFSKATNDFGNCRQGVIDDSKPKFDLNGKSFKHIYMANIPNRDLDLSILEPNFTKKSEDVEKSIVEVPKSAIIEKNDKSQDTPEFQNFNDFREYYKKMNQKPIETEHGRCTCDSSKQVSVIEKPSEAAGRPQFNFYDKPNEAMNYNNNPPPTNNVNSTEISRIDPHRDSALKDLFEIIKQQNQQILSLQQQLFTLQNCIQNRNNTPMLTDDYGQQQQQPQVMGQQFYPQQQQQQFYHPSQQQQQQRMMDSPKIGLPKKFSIDLKATSFEVSFRPQPKFRKYQEFGEPKIQEISETGDGQEELRLDLGQSIDVRDTCPSPTPSIQIDMDEIEGYGDSNDESEEVGPSLYQDIMGQVNHMLERVNIQQTRTNPQQSNSPIHETAKEVKEATVKYLESIGVKPDDNRSKPNYSPTEVSFAVKQLLLKYLPDDQLAHLKSNQSSPICGNSPAVNNYENDKKSPEFSFATVQYMKKYNLLGNKNGTKPKPRTQPQSGQDSPKILDITTLKQQPKLL